jgi:drug/metabolite transporter (DMT)-like permease
MMLLHTVSLAVLYALIKFLTTEMDSNAIVFFYKFAILICTLPWCLFDGLKGLYTKRIWLHMARGFLSVSGSLSMFYAIKHIGLSDVTAVAYLEQMVLLMIGIVYFKEKATKTKFWVILISFIGAILIIKAEYFAALINEIPNTKASQMTNPFYIFVFLAIMFWSINSTVIKVLGKTEKTKVQLFYVMLFSSIIAYPIAFMQWNTFAKFGALEFKYPMYFMDITKLNITMYHIGIIAILALCYFLHVIGHFKAFKHADMSVIVPFEYTRLIFAAIFGFIFFNELPYYPSYIGYTLIIGAGIVMFASERKRQLRKRQAELEEQFEQA